MGWESKELTKKNRLGLMYLTGLVRCSAWWWAIHEGSQDGHFPSTNRNLGLLIFVGKNHNYKIHMFFSLTKNPYEDVRKMKCRGVILFAKISLQRHASWETAISKWKFDCPRCYFPLVGSTGNPMQSLRCLFWNKQSCKTPTLIKWKLVI